MLTKKRKSTLLTLSILMGLTSCTQASEVIQTPDVVVTATKTQQEVKAVPNAVEVIKAHAKKRVEKEPTVPPTEMGEFFTPMMVDVLVGGATIFVLPIEHFEKC